MKNFSWFQLLFHYESHDTVLFYIKSDKIQFHIVIALTQRSRVDGQLPGTERSVSTKHPYKSSIFLMPTSSRQAKGGKNTIQINLGSPS
jgi:hypothetical protein